MRNGIRYACFPSVLTGLFLRLPLSGHFLAQWIWTRSVVLARFLLLDYDFFSRTPPRHSFAVGYPETDFVDDEVTHFSVAAENQVMDSADDEDSETDFSVVLGNPETDFADDEDSETRFSVVVGNPEMDFVDEDSETDFSVVLGNPEMGFVDDEETHF